MPEIPNPFTLKTFKTLKKLIGEAVNNPDAIDKTAKRIMFLFGEGEKPPTNLQTRYIKFDTWISRQRLDLKDFVESARDLELPVEGGDCTQIGIDYTLSGTTVLLGVSGATEEDAFDIYVQFAPSGGTVGDISSVSIEGRTSGMFELETTGPTDQYHYYFSITDRTSGCRFGRTDSLGAITLAEMPLSILLPSTELMPLGNPLDETLPPDP